MRKWKCTNAGRWSGVFTVGKIYESDDCGFGIVDDDGFMFVNLSPCYGSEHHFGFCNTKFEEVKDDCKTEFGTLNVKHVIKDVMKLKEFTKSDLQELDVVVLRNGNRLVWFQDMLRGKNSKMIDYYRKKSFEK